MVKLYNFYKEKVINNLMQKNHYKSIMQVPQIKKITLNVGLGKILNNKKLLDNTAHNLSLISGQKPIFTKAKKSIAGFKIREGCSIGCKVTLRKKFMWDFFERLIFIVIPRIKDFRGLPLKSFDGHGNYNIGIREQIIFPEINYDTMNHIHGLNITITTNANSDNEAYMLLHEFNFPFYK